MGKLYDVRSACSANEMTGGSTFTNWSTLSQSKSTTRSSACRISAAFAKASSQQVQISGPTQHQSARLRPPVSPKNKDSPRDAHRCELARRCFLACPSPSRGLPGTFLASFAYQRSIAAQPAECIQASVTRQCSIAIQPTACVYEVSGEACRSHTVASDASTCAASPAKQNADSSPCACRL